MKKIIFLILLLGLVFSTIAQDLYNKGTVTKKAEGYTYVLYKWEVTIPSGATATDNYHSPAIFIGDANVDDGTIQVKASQAANANLVYHYSNDNENWVTVGPDNNLKNLTNTFVTDTLGMINGSNDLNFHNSTYIVLELDGQTGNSTGTTWTVYIRLKKPSALYSNISGQPIIVGKSWGIITEGTP